MGNKTPANWQIVSITPEGDYDVIASCSNISVANVAYEEALKQRPDRIVMLTHGSQILCQGIGKADRPR